MGFTQRVRLPRLFRIAEKLFSLPLIADDASDLMLSPVEAAAELDRRQRIPGLRAEVEAYLKGDIPSYFNDGPVLYLGRHIATPNFETLRFVHLVEPLGMKTVISQDTKDLFVSQNHTKRALCKLPICTSITKSGEQLKENIRYLNIVDFNTCDGKPFSEVTTRWGEPLVDFHTRLFKMFAPAYTETPDDAEWIDRHHRGNLREHFKKLLALFLVHGVLFEDYIPQDAAFVRKVFRPAMQFVEKRFGLRPLVSQLVPKSVESELFWISYPHKVIDFVKASEVHKS